MTPGFIDPCSNEPRSQFLRGWLSESETRDLVALCEEEDVSLHGLVLAAGLTAMARYTSSFLPSIVDIFATLHIVALQFLQLASQQWPGASFLPPSSDFYRHPPTLWRCSSCTWPHSHDHVTVLAVCFKQWPFIFFLPPSSYICHPPILWRYSSCSWPHINGQVPLF